MAEHRLIQRYTDELIADLPAPLAEEVADGLAEANTKYLRRGLSSDDAALAAIAEFGDARAVADAFTRCSPARRIVRRLIVTGPLVGGCWAAVLITGRAWQWPVPSALRVLLGATLAASVTVLLTAAVARRYRVVRVAGLAGCGGLMAIDISAITVALAAVPALRGLVVVAVCASASRLVLVAKAIHPVLA